MTDAPSCAMCCMRLSSQMLMVMLMMLQQPEQAAFLAKWFRCCLYNMTMTFRANRSRHRPVECLRGPVEWHLKHFPDAVS